MLYRPLNVLTVARRFFPSSKYLLPVSSVCNDPTSASSAFAAFLEDYTRQVQEHRTELQIGPLTEGFSAFFFLSGRSSSSCSSSSSSEGILGFLTVILRCRGVRTRSTSLNELLRSYLRSLLAGGLGGLDRFSLFLRCRRHHCLFLITSNGLLAFAHVRNSRKYASRR